MKLSIVIPVWNNWTYTKSCLRDLSELPDDHEIIVVNDGSTDNTSEGLKEFPKCKHIKSEINHGFAYSCNKGYESSVGEYIMFLNNDIKVIKDHKTWTEPIIEEAKKGGLVGPTIGVLGANLAFVCESGKMPTRGYPYMSGWNITAARGVWERLIPESHIGPVSEDYGRAFYEDADVSFRARDIGILFSIVSVPIRHFGHMTTKKINISELYQQAREIFVKKWGNRTDLLLK